MAIDFTPTKLTLTEIYEITFADGAIAYFTSHDKDIIYDANTYQAIPITRGPVRYHTNLQVDKVDISFGLVGVKIGTKQLSIPEVIRRDFIRNAHVKIYIIDYITLTDTKLIFEGWVTGKISHNAGIITVGVGSLLDKLKEKFPKLIYSEFCNHQLYNSYCGLTKANYLVQDSAATNSDRQNIYSTVFAFSTQAEGYWDKGELKMTSGNNNGVSRSILKHYDGHIKLTLPFSEDIQIADTFDVWPGCDKSGQTCDEKFSNYNNFFGFEYIPKPEVLIP